MVIESIFYVFNMSILFFGALRDYRMFGNGLKEYYTGKSGLRRKKGLSLVGTAVQ